MKMVLFMLALALLGLAPAAPNATPPAPAAAAVEHGGGCRRSSPPGQCCHMETRVGRVHCH